MALAYQDAGRDIKLASVTCDRETTKSGAVGRPGDNPACRDSNAGTWHVFVTNMMGLRRKGVVVDRHTGAEVWNQPTTAYRTTDYEVWNQPLTGSRYTGGEVWNQPLTPLWRYKITNAEGGALKEVSKAEARQLLGATSRESVNINTARVFDVTMEIQYVTSAPATRTSRIGEVSNYSKTARLRYLLEVARDGAVVDGHWVGGETSAHPGFVWTPVQKPKETVFGKAFTYNDVKELNDLASDPKLIRKETKVLLKDFTVKAGVSRYIPIGIPADGTVDIQMTGSGDADLYTRSGMVPTMTVYECKSAGPTSTENCTIKASAAGASYYLRVRSNAPSSTVTVTATTSSG